MYEAKQWREKRWGVIYLSTDSSGSEQIIILKLQLLILHRRGEEYFILHIDADNTSWRGR